MIGGGSTPQQSIPTWLITLEYSDVVAAEKSFAQANPPVIARIEDGRLLLDLRTVFPEEEEELKRAFKDLA